MERGSAAAAVVIVSFMKTWVGCKSEGRNIRRRGGHGSNQKARMLLFIDCSLYS